MVQTDIHIEVTDLFGGEPNYGWCRREVIHCARGEDYSDLAAVRRVKRLLGWQGWRCRTSNIGDMIELRPVHNNVVAFITFHSHGSAS